MIEGAPKKAASGESISYSRPTSPEKSRHKIEIRIDGKNAGEVYMAYRSIPIPFYFVQNLKIKKSFRGKGLGAKVMSLVEETLKEKGKPGVLIDDINPKSPAAGMYERRGWKRFDSCYFVFNLPESIDVSRLHNILDRGQGSFGVWRNRGGRNDEVRLEITNYRQQARVGKKVVEEE